MNDVKCDYCGNDADLVKGDAIYPHRPDLYKLNFYQCEPCKAYVGCHRKNKKHDLKGIEPLGRLANANLRRLKSATHAVFDPHWRTSKDKSGKRLKMYSKLSKELNIPLEETHVGMFSEEMCRKAIKVIEKW